MRAEAKKIYNKLKLSPPTGDLSLYDIAEEEMSKIVWIPIVEDLSPDKMAFVTKSTSNAYKLFVNNKIPAQYRKWFKLHEYGHILFGHLKFTDFQRKQLTKKVLQYWPKIEPHIDLDDADKGKSKLDLVNKYIIPLQQIIENYAMDMEVNSKLYPSDEEKQDMTTVMSNSMLHALLNDDLVLDVTLKKIEEYIDEGQKEPFAKPVFPRDYEFEDQLSYQEYLDLIFLNIEKFINFLKRDASQQGGQGQGQGQSQGQGQGQGSSSSGSNGQSQSGQGDGDEENGNGKGSGEELSEEDKERLRKQAERDANGMKKRLTLDDIEKLRQRANKSDTDEKSNEDTAEKSGHGKDVEESGNDDDEGSNGSSEGNAVGDVDWTGQSGLGHNHATKPRPDVIPLGNGASLAKIIEKEAFSKKIVNTRENIMWYYNRRKYGDKDIISKQVSENLYRPGNLYILVDCSGSINKNAISIMLKAIRIVAKKCGPRSRVIWWDTNLVADYSIRETQKPICGGGTDIGAGMEYVRDRYLKKSNDKLIIISDYEDSLGKWQQVADTFSNDITGIGWTYDLPRSAEDFIGRTYWGDRCNPKKFNKRIHTKVVKIEKGSDWF